MSQPESDPGTGVKEVIDLLLKAPPQRLCSLTYQLGPSTEEDIVHALCLFILQKGTKALDKLQAQRDNIVARHLSEKWQKSARNIEEFKRLCGNLQESDSLVTLARMFNVLTQHGLCDRSQLNLAYKRALPRESSDSNALEYNRFIEEAKEVCGPDLQEFLFTFTNSLKVASATSSPATTCVAQDPSQQNVLTSLRTVSSEPSFPEHLEISAPPTNRLSNDQTVPSGSLTRRHSYDDIAKPDFSLHGQGLQSTFPKQPTEPTCKPSPEHAFEASGKEDTEEEEDKFYSFVILHALQDAEVAEEMKETLEDIIKSEGATFSGNFEVAGKKTLMCVEDAINNSAFTLLLLTTSFNSFMEMKANSALINSIENRPSHNTVIPLLPKRNAMPRDDLPMVLKTLVPLRETENKKNFEKKAKQALNPTKIKHQREEWMNKQRMKRLKEKQERLTNSNHQRQKEYEVQREVLTLEQQNERYNIVQGQWIGPDGRLYLQQQHPNINITNAKYIIIGDNSQMAVDLSREAGHNEDT